MVYYSTYSNILTIGGTSVYSSNTSNTLTIGKAFFYSSYSTLNIEIKKLYAWGKSANGVISEPKEALAILITTTTT